MEIKRVNISIDGQQIVRIDHWHLKKGQMYGLCGETGSGKSTIGKWLANVDPVYWEVNPVFNERQQSIINFSWMNENGSSLYSPLYLLQDAYQIFNPYVPILTHFKDVWRNQSDRSEIKHFDDIFTILDEIGVSDSRSVIKRKVHQISQGEAQRMAFVLGILRPAPLRIYDEVFSNVDAEASDSILSWLRQYCRDSGTTVIVISHETRLLSPFTDTMYQVRNGLLDEVTILPQETPSKPGVVDCEHLINIEGIVIPAYKEKKGMGSVLARMPEFRIGREENVGIYGESGVGKTTLLKGLLGEHELIYKDGQVLSGSEENIQSDLSQLDIRYLPQSVASGFNPVCKLRTSINEIQSVQNVEDKELHHLLKSFDLDPVLLDKYPDELSGGEIQRMGIISVLLGQPDLILLDESFSSVDQTTRDNIWKVLMEEQQNYSFALLVVSHDVDWLQKNMNRVYSIDPVSDYIK